MNRTFIKELFLRKKKKKSTVVLMDILVRHAQEDLFLKGILNSVLIRMNLSNEKM